MYEHRYRENSFHGFPDFPFHIYTIEHPNHVHTILPIHWHNEMEIIYLVKGTATFKVENIEYSIKAGEAVIVHPGELHSGVSNDKCEIFYFSIVFKFSWLSSLHNDRIQEQFLAPILSTSRLPAVLRADFQEHLELLNHIRQILNKFERKSAAYEMNLKATLLLLIADSFQYGLIESRTEPKMRRGHELSWEIKQVLAFMEEHSHGKIELNQLASIISLSRSHFCKFFKDQTGMRPMEYLNFIRVNKAATLLRTGSYNVIEAALESGFQHVSYFTKWFKTFMNMTPSEYKTYYSTGI
jgi:AraC-like DNA-binding protein